MRRAHIITLSIFPTSSIIGSNCCKAALWLKFIGGEMLSCIATFDSFTERIALLSCHQIDGIAILQELHALAPTDVYAETELCSLYVSLGQLKHADVACRAIVNHAHSTAGDKIRALYSMAVVAALQVPTYSLLVFIFVLSSTQTHVWSTATRAGMICVRICCRSVPDMDRWIHLCVPTSCIVHSTLHWMHRCVTSQLRCAQHIALMHLCVAN